MILEMDFKETVKTFGLEFKEEDQTFDPQFESLQIANVNADYYTGEYELTPKGYLQTLETAQKIMADDVKVRAIPYAEVTNLANGLTVTIGDSDTSDTQKITVTDDGIGNLIVNGISVKNNNMGALSVFGANAIYKDGNVMLGGK